MPRLWFRPFLAALLSLLSAHTPCWAVMPSRTGQTPPAVGAAFEHGLFRLPRAPELGTSAASGVWKVPVILIDFSDQPLTYPSPAEWKHVLFDTTGATATGSIFDYYRWASGNRLRVIGDVVASVRMSQPKSYYAYNSWGLSSTMPRNSAGATLEAIVASDDEVNWSEYDRDLDGYVDMLWVVHSGVGGEHSVSRENLWSITSRLSDWIGAGAFVTDDMVPGTSMRVRIDAFSMLPEMSGLRPGMRSEIGVYCHEFGHALGLPDLYDTSVFGTPSNVGPGNWSLMSTGAYGTDGNSPEYPAHVGAWPAVYLGWKQPVRPAHDTLMTVPSLGVGGPVVELWFQGEPNIEHFLVENRQREAFDRNLIQEGLIVYQVNDAVLRAGIPANRVLAGPYPALRIIEGDGRQDLMNGWNRGDASDPMPGSSGLVRWDDTSRPSSRSMFGNVTHVGMENVQFVGDDVRFLARVRASGWRPARNLTASGFQPLIGSGPAARTAALGAGAIAAVTSEFIQGRPQVVFRERLSNRSWEPPLPISQSPSSASEPTIAAIPGGDACVVWSDSRHGANELYFRSRIRGVWTPERRLTDLPGTSRGPSLGADARGGLHLAWIYHDSQGLRVHFMYFTYASPFGDPIPVSPPGGSPELPSVAVAPSGRSYVLWPERASTPVSLWSALFSPDSGLRPPSPITSPQSGTLPAVHGVVVDDRLHVVWSIAGAGGSELRFLRAGEPAGTIVRRGEPIEDFMMTSGPGGGLHVVMEAAREGSSQILYKEWRPNGGWDVGDTEVTLPEDGVAARPALLAWGEGLTVLYTGYPGGAAGYMERDRDLAQPVTAVRAEPAAAPLWRVRPNPVRAGRALILAGEGAPLGTEIELFDLAGRVMARAAVTAAQGGWRAEIAAAGTIKWRSGVYFARFQGGGAKARIVVLR